uniref:(northern house mosquito) hypothetical protein n=1 Tax=Culex pipiens TaxID=7175 RepID=A0A8D8ML48_CULPI
MRKASTTTATTLTGVTPPQQQGQTQQSSGQQQQQGEELGSGDFSSLNTKFTDEDGNSKKDDQSSNGGGTTRRKIGLRTPTDFSEAETTSSGFSDEISNKATQTDERPRNFLCTIADGEDCKFSIYEDQTVIDSRFRFSPSHRELFREIFGILKKAADNRDEGDQLPLLDDQNPVVGGNGGKGGAPKVPPVTPAAEEPPSEFGDDTQSVISSAVSEQSFAMSECITKSERKKIEKQNKYAEKHGEQQQENKPPVGVAALPDGRILTPYKRQPLDYLTVAVGVNKKKSRRRRNRGTGPDMDRSDSPVSTTPSSPRCGSSGKKGRTLYRPWNPNAASPATPSSSNLVSTSSPNGTATAEWNGTSMTIYNRSINSPTPSSQQQPRTPASGQSGAASTSFCSPVAANPVRPANHNRFADLADDTPVQFKPSTASHDLHKLKKLDLSYAEVLRRADLGKQRQRQHHHK